MKIQYVFFCLLFYPFFSKGQNETFYSYLFLEIEKPKKDLETKLRFTDESFFKTTKSYDLIGDVKSINESVYQNDGANWFSISRKYFFNEKKKLLSLELDSVGLNKGVFQPTYEHYFYDDSGNKLLRVEYQNDQYRCNNSKTVYFDSLGYLSEEHFKSRSYSKSDYHKNGINVFDYDLTYFWSKNKDTLQMKYNYLTDESVYDRQKDKMYTFREKEVPEKQFSLVDIGSFENEVVVDSNENIVRITRYDFTIKNSYNQHFRSSYEYNERNELIEIRHESSIQDLDNFSCFSIVKIDYLNYDKKGNWTLAKLTNYRLDNFSGSFFEIPKVVYELFFTREFIYFE